LKQVRHYYANPVALAAARAGTRLPDGIGDPHRGLHGEARRPPRLAKGPDGIYIPNQLAVLFGDGARRGLGRDIPEILRNEDWNYAAFTPQGQPRPRSTTPSASRATSRRTTSTTPSR
jgi:hypothetical protein